MWVQGSRPLGPLPLLPGHVSTDGEQLELCPPPVGDASVSAGRILCATVLTPWGVSMAADVAFCTPEWLARLISVWFAHVSVPCWQVVMGMMCRYQL